MIGVQPILCLIYFSEDKENKSLKNRYFQIINKLEFTMPQTIVHCFCELLLQWHNDHFLHHDTQVS